MTDAFKIAICCRQLQLTGHWRASLRLMVGLHALSLCPFVTCPVEFAMPPAMQSACYRAMLRWLVSLRMCLMHICCFLLLWSSCGRFICTQPLICAYVICCCHLAEGYALHMQVRVRFNASEAIQELLRLNLISEVDGGDDDVQHYTAVAPNDAAEHLTLCWQQLLSQRVDSRIQHIV